MKYPKGTKFIKKRGKVIRECEVVDFHVTKNLEGEIVKSRYVTIHKLMGKNVFDYDVVQTTIDMSEII